MATLWQDRRVHPSGDQELRVRVRSSAFLSSVCILLLLCAAGCRRAGSERATAPGADDVLTRTFEAGEPISAERLGGQLAARAGANAAKDVAYLVAGAMIAKCDSYSTPGDGLITTPSERTCLEALDIDGAWKAKVTEMLATPPAVSEPGLVTTLLLIALVVFACPWAIDRSMRIAGWRLGFTRGKWFRLPSILQLVIAVVAGAVVYGVVLVVLILMNVQWNDLLAMDIHWRNLLHTSLWRDEAHHALRSSRVIDFYHLAHGKIRLLGILSGVVALSMRYFRIVDSSSRIKGLLSTTPAAPSLPSRRSPRNLVICCDGTGNRAEAAADGRRAVSNVRKFFEVAQSDVESAWQQDKWYDDGVGTGTSGESRKLSMLEKLSNWLASNTSSKVLGVLSSVRAVLELGFGIGITENITQGYAELVRMYQPGDRIFIVGFSRGAYTARCIADVIDDIGLLRAEHVRYAPDIIQLYRYRQSPDEPVAVRAELLHQNVEIEFLGLWDTVASLGVPLWGWSFSIFKLWSNAGFGVTTIRNCKVIRHALSMDEQRSQFFPTMFDESALAPGQDLQQRWFRGSHAGVGGGYADTSLSDIALGWIIEEACKCGLVVHEAWDKTVLKRTDQDFYPNPIGQVITELERQKAWRVSGAWPRWHPCVSGTSAGHGVLDETVRERADKAASLRLTNAPVCSDELLTLRPGDTANVRLMAHLGWNRTGVVLENGGCYRITYVSGVWQDKECRMCGPSGQKAGIEARRLLGWGRRVPSADWMELIGHVAHPRDWDTKERGGFMLLDYLLFREPRELMQSLIPLGRHLKQVGDSVEVVVEADGGVFYGYANDWWLAYDNNSGSVLLSIERLADGAAPQTSRYVVAADGRILDEQRKPLAL
ncbi:MAG: DUF2235 domain-containing protein [Vicinamibacterales bacterium]